MPILPAVLGFLGRHWRPLLVAVAVASVVGGGLWVKNELDTAYRERAQALLSLDSLEAVKDTTRLRQVQAYGRIVDVYQRRAVQTQDLNDELTDSLDMEVRARTALETRVRDLETSAEGTVTTVVVDSDSLAAAEFEFRQEPFEVWAQVVMDDPPIMDIRISVDPMNLGVYVGCQPPGRGISPAFVSVETPPWAVVGVVNPRFHPDVCNPGILDPPSMWERIKPAAQVTGLVGGIAGTFVIIHKLATGSWLPF